VQLVEGKPVDEYGQRVRHMAFVASIEPNDPNERINRPRPADS
jgi:hypothetical protein